MNARTLATFPFVTVRLACSTCDRAGRYRLARLAERFGADANLVTVLASLAADCPVKRRENDPCLQRCGARYADLRDGPAPYELPSAITPQPKLRVVEI
jgi:hypothetical protein